MQHYRLLRNNRESGPYTQQDLIDLGLKAYDLIWMEGKSSSWKYPSEVESLKSYAPPATEDLYVLFHTPKMARQSPPTTVSAKTTSTTTLPKAGNRRYVSVILPTTTNRELNPVSPGFANTQAPVVPIVNEPRKEQPAEFFNEDSRIAVTNIITYKSKNRYLIAASLLVLLATGIYFGTASKISPASQQDPIEQATGSLVSLTTPITERNENLNNTVEIPALKPNKTLDFAAVKRHIQVNIAEYRVGFFGGISGLKLTVKNSGKIKLNHVVIAVDFLNRNKIIHHTENIAIPLIDPGKAVTIPVHDSPDGIAIQTRVIGVNDLSPQ